ncbi:hypothetical protein [Sinorhizobium meliloti]|uniref:hypothetical protein n=1 Tax=Rhizobium meliloti TaxID=382 RepID=UPI0012FD56C1|nr:hypothetical protein [Sinorhizobium meliloti]
MRIYALEMQACRELLPLHVDVALAASVRRAASRLTRRLRFAGQLKLAAPDTCILRTRNFFPSAKAALLSISQSTALVLSTNHD